MLHLCACEKSRLSLRAQNEVIHMQLKNHDHLLKF